MSISNFMDLVDAILQVLLTISDINNLDINISIGMIFIMVLRDLRNVTWIELIPQFVAWFIFHTYILCFEKQYFEKGESKQLYRENSYKIMDTLQLIIGTTYLGFTMSSTLEILLLVFFSINLFLNCCELVNINYIRDQPKEDYKKTGGYKPMFCGFFLGCLGIIIFSYISADKYQVELRESSLLFVVSMTIIGEVILLVTSLYYYYKNSGDFDDTSDCTKRTLGFLYGLNIGCFSILYGFITGILGLIYFFYSWTCKKDKKQKRTQVPTDTQA